MGGKLLRGDFKSRWIFAEVRPRWCDVKGDLDQISRGIRHQGGGFSLKWLSRILVTTGLRKLSKDRGQGQGLTEESLEEPD